MREKTKIENRHTRRPPFQLHHPPSPAGPIRSRPAAFPPKWGGREAHNGVSSGGCQPPRSPRPAPSGTQDRSVRNLDRERRRRTRGELGLSDPHPPSGAAACVQRHSQPDPGRPLLATLLLPKDALGVRPLLTRSPPLSALSGGSRSPPPPRSFLPPYPAASPFLASKDFLITGEGSEEDFLEGVTAQGLDLAHTRRHQQRGKCSFGGEPQLLVLPPYPSLCLLSRSKKCEIFLTKPDGRRLEAVGNIRDGGTSFLLSAA